ncbi:hypothetical protein FRC11_008434 [Ceratobasidium sp. 423]|nr:hypothetical protein FRC11_008434 [Ceratobasidium sp. 423]
MSLRRPPADNYEWRLDRLLKRKAEQGVKIYVIAYKEVPQVLSISSRHTKDALNALHPNIMCLRHPDHIGSDSSVWFWSHHEKVIVVDNIRACVGGLDVCFGRWDTHNHPLADCHPTDVSRTLFPGQDYNNARVLDFHQVDNYESTRMSRLEIGRMPLHDIHMTLIGPVVFDIAQHFVERWNEIKLRKYKNRVEVDWLALPYNPKAEPKEAVSRHPFFEYWHQVGHQFGHSWPGEVDLLDGKDDHPSSGSCRVQVVRSVGDWSHGVLIEDSVHHAYVQMIREARYFIYIENQFFISNTGIAGPVKNMIGKALVERIIEAARCGEKFKVVVVIPEALALVGDIRNERALKTAMAAQYRTTKPIPVNRGGQSVYEEIRRAGFEPQDYIRFYHLRTYDRINSPISLINRMEQNSGISYHQARVAQARLRGGDDGFQHQVKVLIQDPQSDFGMAQSETATTGSVTRTTAKEEDFPPSSKEAAEVVERLESGAIGEGLCVADNVGQHVLAGQTGLKDEKWYGTEQEERDSCGRGEEVTPYMRPAPIPNEDETGTWQDDVVSDPLSDRFQYLWISTAQKNRAIYSELFKTVPTNVVRNWAQYRTYLPKGKTGHLATELSLPAVKSKLSQIRGHLVEAQLEFLIEEPEFA